MKPYVVLHKHVGETPLQTLLKYKTAKNFASNVPMAYAGRLDPMASGTLLVLIGNECKKQTDYHGLDKEYTFEVLLGTSSDTGDVLGLLEWKEAPLFTWSDLVRSGAKLFGNISLPYPHFSSKTVQGKPLHVWALEKRLDEIEIPVTNTQVYTLQLKEIRVEKTDAVYRNALKKIESIPPVTAVSKKLGNDFRRDEVRIAWKVWLENHKNKEVQIATFKCICSSGTYMRSLAQEIGKALNTEALAYSIHRTKIGTYQKLPLALGFWRNTFK